MRAPTRFNPIDFYRKAGKAVKPLYGKTRQIKHRPVDKVPLDTIPQMFKELSGPIADYITGEREKKDRENMQKALMAYRSGLPGQKERIDLSEQEIMDKYARPAKDAVIGGPMDIDETSDDIERRADDAWFNALPDIDDQGRFTQGKRLEGFDAAVAAAGDKPGPVTQKMLNALLLSDMDRKQALAAEQRALADKITLKQTPGGPNSPTGRPSSPIQNFAELQRLEDAYPAINGQDSPEVANFKNFVRATQYKDTGRKIVQMRPNGPPIPAFKKEVPIEKTPEHAGLVEGTKKAAALSIKVAGEAWESLGKVNVSIGNMNDAIAAIDAGARTGAIDEYLPNIRSSSVELSNIRNRMGLDVIGGVTFGALSKGELDLALSTALPIGLDEPKLREWLVKKKEAQSKLAKYYSSAATYLGTPGNTVAKWAEMQKSKGAANVDDKVKQALKKYGG